MCDTVAHGPRRPGSRALARGRRRDAGADWLRDPVDARRVLLEDALRGSRSSGARRARSSMSGSGGGTPGSPRRVASRPGGHGARGGAPQVRLPRAVDGELPNLRVVRGRAEEQPPDGYGVAGRQGARAPADCRRSCLPLVREGGAVLLWVGPSVDEGRVAKVADRLAARPEPAPAGFVLLREVGPPHPASPAVRVSLASGRWPDRWTLGPQRGNVRAPGYGDRVPALIYAIANQKGGVGRRRPPSTSQPVSQRPASAA